jgi:hypothetical protein
MATKKKRGGGGAARPAAPRAEARRSAAATPRRDIRRWIYAALDLVFAVIYFIVARQMLTQSTLDTVQLMTLPVFAAAMCAGMVISGRVGWWIAVAGCAALLLSAVLLMARILMSISFFAAVYGGFGKAASSFALLAVALIVELVVLVPLFQLKYLNSRAGRRTLGVATPIPVPAT